ncbi:MAG TPA: NAD(P)-dependent oxidoreductase [Solirubrobacteraceae bacterium]|nr:NAD(P)-dependent oxidoreductase [Solirubrobacteraceae bacterium]
MILITGGLGFIGAHVTGEFAAHGHRCVAAQRRVDAVPSFVADRSEVVVETLDVADGAALAELVERHDVGSIVHLAAPPLARGDLMDDWEAATRGMVNVLRVARDSGMGRVTVASTIGVYLGATEGPLREDQPLSLSSPHPIPAVKKSLELICDLAAGTEGIDVAVLRVGAIWGPLGAPSSPFFGLPALVHAAARGDVGSRDEQAHEAIDSFYVRDCARAIVAVHTARELPHRIFNIGAGRVTTNAEVALAIERAEPGAKLALADGGAQWPPMVIDRLASIGYAPTFDLDAALADYMSWLRAGNPR